MINTKYSELQQNNIEKKNNYYTVETNNPKINLASENSFILKMSTIMASIQQKNWSNDPSVKVLLRNVKLIEDQLNEIDFSCVKEDEKEKLFAQILSIENAIAALWKHHGTKKTVNKIHSALKKLKKTIHKVAKNSHYENKYIKQLNDAINRLLFTAISEITKDYLYQDVSNMYRKIGQPSETKMEAIKRGKIFFELFDEFLLKYQIGTPHPHTDLNQPCIYISTKSFFLRTIRSSYYQGIDAYNIICINTKEPLKSRPHIRSY